MFWILIWVEVTRVYTYIEIHQAGTSLVVQWLRLRISTAGSVGSIPGRGTKILLHGVAKKKKKERKKFTKLYIED